MADNNNNSPLPKPPLEKKPKVDLGLGKAFYDLRATGTCVDVYFSVPSDSSDDPVKVPAHRIVLVATSSTFSTMMKERWNPGDVINVPEKINLKAVEQLVFFLYHGELKDGIDTDLLLQVMLLSDHYEIEGLFGLCDTLLIKSVNKDNCVFIYQHTRLFERSGIKMEAMDCILANISTPLWQQEMSDWDAETLKDLINMTYLKNVSEATLFKRLMAWRGIDLDETTRREKFQALLKFVRFPLMTLEEFAEFVVPSGVLSKNDMLEIFVYFAGKGITKFPTTKRNIIVAKDSKEFKSALEKVVCGDVIQLCETIYDGPFILKDDGITIQGVNETKSIIQFPFASTTTSIFSITASHCCIKNLSLHSLKYDKNSPRKPVLRISGDNNNFSNISIYNGYNGLYVAGSNNTFDNFSITGSIYCCVRIRGNGNIFLNGSVTFSRYGYFILGNENVISSSQCKDVVRGVIIDGNNNSIQDITYKMVNPGQVFEKLPIVNAICKEIFKMTAVFIQSGKNNSVSTVTTEVICLEGVENRTWSIILDPETKFCKVEKCKGDGQNKDGWVIRVQGESHTLIDVDGGLCFKVGGTGHKLDKCRAVKLLKVGADCLEEVKNCNFPSVVREELGPEAVVDNP